MRKFYLIMLLVLCVSLSACGNVSELSEDSKDTSTSSESTAIDADSQIPDTQKLESELDEKNLNTLFFKSDEVINNFFVKYNDIAEIQIPAEEIEKGNIRTKALVYLDDLNLEIINAGEYLSVSMSSSVESESTTLYRVFSDTIKAMRVDISEYEIQNACNDIHASGYLVESYALSDINISYVPNKELSFGNSNLRVRLEIPLL